MKKTFILLAIFLLPTLSIGQIYISQVLKEVTLIGPNNVSEPTAVSPEYYEHFLMAEKALKGVQIENKLFIDELNNEKTLRRKDKRKIKAAKLVTKLIDDELLIVKNFQQMWATYTKKNAQLFKLIDHLQNEKCATITSNIGTLSTGDYEIQTETLNGVTELIPLQKDYKEVWKPMKRNGEKIWCLIREESYIINNYGMEILLEKCPTNFALSNNTEFCQRDSPLNLNNKSLVIRIFDKKTNKEVNLENWQAFDCQ